MNLATLELATPTALATYQHQAVYARSASICSAVVVASLAVCVGAGVVSLMFAILAATSLVAISFAAIRLHWVQRNLDRYAAERERARRESARRRALYQVNMSRQEQYVELRVLVERIERSDPIEARRLELEELLDHIVLLAVGHQRCLTSLRVADGGASHATTSISEKAPITRRREIFARRLRHRDETTARLERIANELDSADDLIRLVAQRTACAKLDALIDGHSEIERRLVELDEVDAALGQVASAFAIEISCASSSTVDRSTTVSVAPET